MPPTPFPINPFMERRKSRASTDEIAVVKAAAWAWYQHGSGSDGKPMREFDITRNRCGHKPSRYKLEAIRASDKGKEVPKTPSPIRTHNSLLDTYEIARISQELEFLIQSSSAKVYEKFLARDQDYQKNATEQESEADGIKKKKKEKKEKKVKGFWVRPAVVCGTREDVVDTHRVLGDHRRRRLLPEK
ncbi:hypothetical protein L1049_002471 [Liquidambar formosana]|uniref:Uncharacterized protein n=1 Tax=Liquidambar formosana TaxID=63359 RepID=A0AAP0NEZ1_LIQFO